MFFIELTLQNSIIKQINIKQKLKYHKILKLKIFII